jgi:hypothetical protein
MSWRDELPESLVDSAGGNDEVGKALLDLYQVMAGIEDRDWIVDRLDRLILARLVQTLSELRARLQDRR